MDTILVKPSIVFWKLVELCGDKLLQVSLPTTAATTGQQTGQQSHPLGPFKLATVNTTPDRAKRLVGRMCEEVKSIYQIIHVANITSKLRTFLCALGWLIRG